MGKDEDGESCSNDESSDDEENQTVSSHGTIFINLWIILFWGFL